MKIKIDRRNLDRINSELAAVNGKAESHTFTSFGEVEACAKEAEAFLVELGLSKRHQVGARMRFTSGGVIPRAYKWKRKLTVLLIDRLASGWFLRGVGWEETWGDADLPEYFLTIEQDGIIVSKVRSRYIAPVMSHDTAMQKMREALA